MRKLKLLSALLSAMMVCPSMAAVSATSVSAAADFIASEHTFGVIGGFCDWEGGVEMTDEDGDGVYTGTVDKVGTYEFKVRADSAWNYNWGSYEAEYDRTQNSQTNFCATVNEGEKLIVRLDTTKVADEAKVNPNSYVNDPDFDFDRDGCEFWSVTF